jgi:hypothetical protein
LGLRHRLSLRDRRSPQLRPAAEVRLLHVPGRVPRSVPIAWFELRVRCSPATCSRSSRREQRGTSVRYNWHKTTDPSPSRRPAAGRMAAVKGFRASHRPERLARAAREDHRADRLCCRCPRR